MKDAFGHGSNSREGSITSQLRARLGHVTSLKGSPSGGVAMTSNGHAAQALQSTTKSAPAPVHDSMNDQGHAYGSPEAIKDFTNKYGGPRDHAAEQRGFNSGQREIARLRGKGPSKDWSSEPIMSLKGKHH